MVSTVPKPQSRATASSFWPLDSSRRRAARRRRRRRAGCRAVRGRSARGAVRHDPEPAAGAERTATRRHDLNLVRVARHPARHREDLVRAGHVEGLGTLEGEYRDPPHAPIMARDGLGSNDY
jgi:hypothetical protein